MVTRAERREPIYSDPLLCWVSLEAVAPPPWHTKDVEYSDGELRHRKDIELKMTLKEIPRRLNGTGGPIVGRGTANPSGGVGNAFGLHIVDVKVDPETDKVDIIRYTALQDAGKAIHSSYVEGQIQGGAVKGVGWALSEEYFIDNDGLMLNSSFLD